MVAPSARPPARLWAAATDPAASVWHHAVRWLRGFLPGELLNLPSPRSAWFLRWCRLLPGFSTAVPSGRRWVRDLWFWGCGYFLCSISSLEIFFPLIKLTPPPNFPRRFSAFCSARVRIPQKQLEKRLHGKQMLSSPLNSFTEDRLPFFFFFTTSAVVFLTLLFFLIMFGILNAFSMLSTSIYPCWLLLFISSY